MGRGAAKHHRLRDAALVREPVVASLGELGHAVLAKEFRFDALASVLLARRFRAVLTELGVCALAGVRVGPRTPGTIEAVSLIEL